MDGAPTTAVLAPALVFAWIIAVGAEALPLGNVSLPAQRGLVSSGLILSRANAERGFPNGAYNHQKLPTSRPSRAEGRTSVGVPSLALPDPI